MGKILNAITKAASKQRRKMLANQIFERHGGVVQRGAYKGLKLDGSSNISRGPLGLKILGLYEHLVVDEITTTAPFRDLVNFGAADGYMSLGPLIAGYCERSICFELTQEGRDAVAGNARLNGVSDKVEIRGKADDSVMAQLSELGVSPEGTLVLCDIEGAEFFVLNDKVLNDLKGAKMIVELHDRIQNGSTAERDALIARLPEGASHRILRAGSSLDFEGIEDLDALNDTDRGLVMSDGRKLYGEWLVIEYL